MDGKNDFTELSKNSRWERERRTMKRRKTGRIAREKSNSREGAFCIRKGKKKEEKGANVAWMCSGVWSKDARARTNPPAEVGVSYDRRNSSVLILKGFRDGDDETPLLHFQNIWTKSPQRDQSTPSEWRRGNVIKSGNCSKRKKVPFHADARCSFSCSSK